VAAPAEFGVTGDGELDLGVPAAPAPAATRRPIPPAPGKDAPAGADLSDDGDWLDECPDAAQHRRQTANAQPTGLPRDNL
jgi:hypothetical protein